MSPENGMPSTPRATHCYPMLRGNSLPSDRFGAWIVQRVSHGWVSMMSADMTATLRLPVDRFNWYWDQFEAERISG